MKIKDPDDVYCPGNIALFEALYGKNLISLGGEPAIDQLFTGINIKGITALDVGFGLGGVAFYLAKKYQMHVKGVEIYPWMVEHAKKHTPQDEAHLLEFKTYTKEGKIPYSNASFDLVYSKGVLNHVKDKESLFYQINAALKPQGLLVIADWIFAENTEEENEALVYETKQSYTDILEKNGFHKIKFFDASEIFLQHVNVLLEKLAKEKAFIKQQYGNKIYTMIEQDHEALIQKIRQKNKFPTRILAKKK